MEESKWKGAFAGVIKGEEEQVARVGPGLVWSTVRWQESRRRLTQPRTLSQA